MSDVVTTGTNWNAPDANLAGFTFTVPVGPRGLVVYDGLDVAIMVNPKFVDLTPAHQRWAEVLIGAACKGSSSAMRLDEARSEFSANGVVIECVITPDFITPLWAIPTQRWNRGTDKEDIALRMAQMRFMLQGVGLCDPQAFYPPNLRLPEAVQVNPYCTGAGILEGCRESRAVALQSKYVLEEMRNRYALVLPIHAAWRRKAEDHYLVSDVSEISQFFHDNEEI